MNLRLLSLFLILPFLAPAQKNIEVVGRLEYDININDIWAYVDENGKEYAFVGTSDGVSVVDLQDPTQPKEIIRVPGQDYVWRDIKTWDHYAYAVSDQNNAVAGLLIMDLSDLPNSVPAQQWIPVLPEFNDTLLEVHNLWIDELGYCYLSGSNLNEGGNLIFELFTNPEEPQYIGVLEEVYSHDLYVRDEIGYSANIYEGVLSIYDLSDPSNPTLLATQTTPFEFTHNAWLSDDSKTVFTTDEKLNAPTASYDISDLDDIKALDQFRPLGTAGLGALPHNVIVYDDFLVIGHYSEGVIVVDAAYPDNLIQVGNYDTYPEPGSGFIGCWGTYNWLPSGYVLATDITEGLFVLDINYQRACYLTGNVTDASTEMPLFDVDIHILAPDTDPEFTDLFGAYATGLLEAGTHEVVYHKVGYFPDTISINFQNGVLVNRDIALTPRPLHPVSGYVFDQNATALPNGHVMLVNDDIYYETVADATGAFSFPAVFEDEYYLIGGKWGFLYQEKETSIPSNNELEIWLEPGYQDWFNFDLGWTVESSADEGLWERGQPIGTRTGAGRESNPFNDSDLDRGAFCFITGNTGGEAHDNEVNNGYTRLHSPWMDLSEYNQPILSYQAYFFNAWSDTKPNDSLLVWIDNGAEQVLLEEIDEDRKGWEITSSFSLVDYISITDKMRVIVETSDNEERPHLLEAAFDYLSLEEGLPDEAFAVITSDYKLSAHPTLFSESIQVDFVWTNAGSKETIAAQLRLFDINGREVYTLEVDDSGSFNIPTSSLQVGTYFLIFDSGSGKKEAIKLVKAGG